MKTMALPIMKKPTREITAFRSMLEHEHDLVPFKFNNGRENRFVRCTLCGACYCQLCGKILKNNNDNSNNSLFRRIDKLKREK